MSVMREEWCAAREGVLALYRAHLHGRQLSLSHARRIVQMRWYEWAAAEARSETRAELHADRDWAVPSSPAAPKRAIAAIEAFYAANQPFRADQTVYVHPPEERSFAGSGSARDSCERSSPEAAPSIDRLAWSPQGWRVHLYLPHRSWPKDSCPALPRFPATAGSELVWPGEASSEGALTIVLHDLLAGLCAQRTIRRDRVDGSNRAGRADGTDRAARQGLADW